MSIENESLLEDNEDLSSGIFLRDLEEISNALYLDCKPPRASNSSPDQLPNVASRASILEFNSKLIVTDSSHKDKKSSIWNWKPLKALYHIRNQRLNCCFYLHIHSVEGLPSNFNNLNLHVTCKRKNDMLRTRPATVSFGICEFQETLMHRCMVYARRSGTKNLVKYEPELFLLHTNVIEAPALDIGMHFLDLTKLLPLTLEEVDEERRSSARWTTNFNLTGLAKGAILTLSFGFSIMNGNSFEPDSFEKVSDVVGVGGPRNISVVPTISAQASHRQSQCMDTNETFANRRPAAAPSINSLYRKLEEGKTGDDMEFDFNRDPFELLKLKSEDNDTECIMIEQGVETFLKDQVRIEKHDSQRFDSSLIETIDVAEIFKGEELEFDGSVGWESIPDKNEHDENESAPDDTETKPGSSVDELTLEELDLISEEFFTLPDINNYYEQGIHPVTNSSCYINKLKRSLSLDDVEIENDFLNMLSIENSSESPSDCLLTQFVSWENPIVDTDLVANQKESHSDDIDLSIAIQAVKMNHSGSTHSIMSNRIAERLENSESQSLMKERGLDENVFQNTRNVNSGGFGSPVYIPAEEPLKLPTLGEDSGPIIRTNDGGFLRSMNPLLFAKASNGARLVVQVSSPLVLPENMGISTMEIIQFWAAEGCEKMSTQVKELMPLEDIIGKTTEQMISEAEPKVELENKVAENLPFSENSNSLNSCSKESDYVSFENLVPMAIANIEGLLIEGLKIQSGMPVQEAPSIVTVRYSDIEELVKYYSMSLEDWVRLDSGNFDAKDETDENILKVIAALRDKDMILDSGPLLNEDDSDRNSAVPSKKKTMALQVQLRDPIHNYETVGSSMLALVQVERVYSEKDSNGKGFPQFKVLEVLIAGLNVLSSNQQLWGDCRQQQSGYQWLLSSCMAKTNKHCMKSAWHGDVLWSISSSTLGETASWDELVAFNVHVRNPDIYFPDEP